MASEETIKVGLVQIGDKFGNDYYLPYAIGLLQAFAQKNLKNPEKFSFMLPVYKRVDVKDAVDYLSRADIVFFSTYIWNYKINLEIARALKHARKDCLIAFGGPQAPQPFGEMEVFLKDNNFIDVASFGEGEIPFLGILEGFKDKQMEKIPGVAFLKDGSFVYTEASGDAGKMKEGSPYLDGVFDPLIKANPDHTWSALLETNRGCPFTCAYCYWGRKTKKKIVQYDLDRVFKEIDWFSANKIEFIFCCDANFGLFDRDLEIVKKVAENKKKYGYPKAFSVQNTKNSTQKIFELQKILNDAGLQRGVNLALQSMNPKTLKSINRSNISNQTYKELQAMFTKSKIPTFSDLIIGLPDETYETFANGVSEVIQEGQHNRLNFINLMLLDNTTMSDPDYQEKYGLMLKESKVIAHHTSLDNNSEVYETQKLVVGTKTMSKEDWVKTRIFCWIISLFHFNKLLQIPFVLLNKLYQVSYRDLAEVFISKDQKYRQISDIYSVCENKAKEIQEGGSDYIASREWLNIWWPIDEYIFIKIFFNGERDDFYKEAEAALSDFIKKRGINIPEGLLSDATNLNKNLIKLPLVEGDLDITLNYNIFEVYQGVLDGRDVPLQKSEFKYRINRTKEKWGSWDEWFKQVVWYGTKRGAYLYECERI